MAPKAASSAVRTRSLGRSGIRQVGRRRFSTFARPKFIGERPAASVLPRSGKDDGRRLPHGALQRSGAADTARCSGYERGTSA